MQKRVRLSSIVDYRGNFKAYQVKTLANLIVSIKAHGQMEPMLVLERKGKYVLLDGFLRYSALIELGKKTCIIRIIE